ncbi:hypothetical protein PACTADRAFT_4121 [Pachysolen tannophilus NRRL Y-2460]|uniref:Uncharacterized protein n=1 Tax=Pachysolen tannophilus NRRL Y-2460 TaxID=669874 RepID=A0A1E4TQZ2_PACTA|nr:hypothetical protein PACTADRAFT_4121 [Pachysolen tannophilus NRRL Y-2460]
MAEAREDLKESFNEDVFNPPKELQEQDQLNDDPFHNEVSFEEYLKKDKNVSLNMFDENDLKYRGIALGEILGGGATNLDNINPSTTSVLSFNIKRLIFNCFCNIYERFFKIKAKIIGVYYLIYQVFWNVIQALMHDDIELHDKQIITMRSRVTNHKNSIVKWAYRLIDIPGYISDVVSSRVLVNVVPTSKYSIINSVSQLDTIPDHITFIFKFLNYDANTPPEIPQPYLNADKKITVPDKKLVSKVLSERAEYFTSKKTHIAAEKVRIYTETARLSTWCLASGVKFLTIYEESGELWNDLKKVANFTASELVALYHDSYHPSIKFINFNTNACCYIPEPNLDNNVTTPITSNDMKDPLSPYSPRDMELNERVSFGEMFDKWQHENKVDNEYHNENNNNNNNDNNKNSNSKESGLTVLLLSKKDHKEHMVNFVKNYVANINNNLVGEELYNKVYQDVDKELNRYGSSDLILNINKDKTIHSDGCLHGLPIYNYEKAPVLFVKNDENLNFSVFLRSLKYWSENR